MTKTNHSIKKEETHLQGLDGLTVLESVAPMPTISYGSQTIAIKGKFQTGTQKAVRFSCLEPHQGSSTRGNDADVPIPTQFDKSHSNNVKDVRDHSSRDDSQASAPELRNSNFQMVIGYPSDVPTRPEPTNSEIVVTQAFPVTDESIRIDGPHETAAIPSAEVVVLDMYSVTIAGS